MQHAWTCMDVHGCVRGLGDTPASLAAAQGLAATRAGGASTVHQPVTVTLPLSPEPCRSPSGDTAVCWGHPARTWGRPSPPLLR